MRFKSPGGNLSWLSVLWLLVALYLTYSTYVRGYPWVTAYCSVLAIASALIWFDLRLIAWPLLAIFSWATLCSAWKMIFQEFSLESVAQTALAGVSVYELFVWGRNRRNKQAGQAIESAG